MTSDRNNILSRISARESEVRAEDVERLYLAAVSGGAASRVRVKGAPGAGSSELLRQTFDRLFADQRFVKPFYFALRADDRTARDAASRFVYEFLLQSIAFGRNEPRLIAAAPDVWELPGLAPLQDAGWVKEICDTLETAVADTGAAFRTLLASPIRAAVRGRFRVCIIVDDLHHASPIKGGRELLRQLATLSPNPGSSLFLSARRSYPLDATFDRTIDIDVPNADQAAAIADAIAREMEVELSASVRDLLAAYTGGRPGFMSSVISAAANAGTGLTTYREAARIYSSEVVNGSLARKIETDIGDDQTLLEALHLADDQFSLTALAERLSLTGEELDGLVDRLTGSEVIEVAGSSARRTSERVVSDFLEARYLIDRQGLTSAAASAKIAVRFFSSAPRVMETEYRRAASEDLLGLLSAFDGREVRTAVLDYRQFRDRYKGLSDAEIRTQLADDSAATTLPQIVQALDLNDLLPGPERSPELRRAAAGVGFDEDEIVWIAAEIDSKLEADPELTREWIERIQAAAERAELERFKIWLVAPEGFSPGALEILGERNAIGSSRRQLTFLREALGMQPEKDDAQEFEMTIPIGEETELIAVHAVEEIARRYEYPAKAINQVKTAIVEACINAAEHSLSPDRKIYLKFAFYADRLVATVSNRGLRLADKVREIGAGDEPSSETRRGWGLGLMRNLMDDVRLERVDDGTRIVMTKLLVS